VRRHHLGGDAASPEAVTQAMIALHATDPASVYLSVRARSAGSTLADVSYAMYERRSLCPDCPRIPAGVCEQVAPPRERFLILARHCGHDQRVESVVTITSARSRSTNSPGPDVQRPGPSSGRRIDLAIQRQCD
jgi:hypothetical protein